MPESKPSAVVASTDSTYAGAVAAALAGRFDVQVVDLRRVDDLGELVSGVDPAVLIHDGGASFEVGSVHEVTGAVATLVLGPDDPGPMIEAVEAGSLGYLSREAPLADIEQGAASVAQGTAVIPPFMLGSLLHHVVERRRRESAALAHLAGLTPREREVFELAAMGMGHDGVAERLFISPATARTHLHRIFKKLDIHSRAELVALAAAGGFPTSEEG